MDKSPDITVPACTPILGLSGKFAYPLTRRNSPDKLHEHSILIGLFGLTIGTGGTA